MISVRLATFALIGLSFTQAIAGSYDQCRSQMGSITRDTVAILAANICTLDSMNMDERMPFTIKNTTTYLHKFEVNKYDDIIEVTGECAIGTDFHENVITPGHKLHMIFNSDKFRTEKNPVFKGKLDTADVFVRFADTQYYNTFCSGAVGFRELKSISIGDGVWDMLKRKRTNITGFTMNQTWDDMWDRTKLFVDLRVPQWSGRQNRLISSFDRHGNILVKAGLYLHVEEGAQELSPGYNKANNIFMGDRTNYKGCSNFMRASETDIPAMMDVGSCRTLQYKLKDVFLKD